MSEWRTSAKRVFGGTRTPFENVLGFPEGQGDEGELFRRFLIGPALSDHEIQNIKREDDSALIKLNGIESRIERFGGWPTFPDDNEEFAEWVNWCIEGAAYGLEDLSGKTILSEAYTRNLPDLARKLETALIDHEMKAITDGFPKNLGQVLSIAKTGHRADAIVPFRQVLEKECFAQELFSVSNDDGVTAMSALMQLSSPDQQTELQERFSTFFMKNLSGEFIDHLDTFGQFGDFQVSHPETGEDVFQFTDRFDNREVHNKLCDGLAKRVEEKLSEGTLPDNLDTYFSQSLYNVLKDNGRSEPLFKAWLGKESKLSEKDKDTLAKEFTQGTISTMLNGSEAYLELALTYGSLGETTAHGDNLFDIIQTKAPAATYRRAQIYWQNGFKKKCSKATAI